MIWFTLFLFHLVRVKSHKIIYIRPLNHHYCSLDDLEPLADGVSLLPFKALKEIRFLLHFYYVYILYCFVFQCVEFSFHLSPV